MSTDIVGWRRVFVGLLAMAVMLGGAFVIVRTDGFSAVDVTAPRATRWFVDSASGFVVLADGFSGRTLARMEAGPDGELLEVVQSAGGVAVVDRSDATTRPIDASALRLGPPTSVGLVASPATVVGVVQSGLVVVGVESDEAILMPPTGDAVPYRVGNFGMGASTSVAPDGSIWTIAADGLDRITTNRRESVAADVARYTLVGNAPLMFDGDRNRVRFDGGAWHALPEGVSASEVVLQESGPVAECGWVGFGDDLWCVGRDGVDEQVTISGLQISGSDLLAIAGDAGALVRRSSSQIVRLDWRNERMIDDVVAAVPSGSQLEVSTALDLVWVDQTNGGLVWAVHPWGLNVIVKNDESTPLLGESGEVLHTGTGGAAPGGIDGDDSAEALDREPDDNGIDDPPVAVDDPVTARTGASVQIAVTNNDYDPDGEAVALVAVGDALHGKVEITTASTATYTPDTGFVGRDEFQYTIVDGDGTEAQAVVSVELLPIDAPNGAPTGSPDFAETGPDADVIIDVLLNDIDPERDSLHIGSFTAPDVGGEVFETIAASGLPGLRFVPPVGASGTATFTYRPLDSFGAVGEPVTVTIEIAQPSDVNRAPVLKPDAVRARRDIPVTVPVLANDRDPDGDPLVLSRVEPVPPGLEIEVSGSDLVIVARAGVDPYTPFTYSVDDGNGNRVIGYGLVALIDDVEPNRPPTANADSATAVLGTPQFIDVLANDTDPDGDPVILLSVYSREGASAVTVQDDRVLYTAPALVDDGGGLDRFTYTITDGNGHEAIGTVTVRVLPERIAAPPFAQDDSAITVRDVAVTLDVLSNDNDPSGERPSIVGTPGCAAGGTAIVTTDARVTFTPPAGQLGVFRCTYEVTNSQGLRASAAINVSVIAPAVANEAPVVVDEDVAVVVGERVVVDLLANDTDPDGPHENLRVLSSTTPALGTASRDGSRIVYTAGENTGAVVITYQVGDERGGISTGRLVIRIVEPDPLPPIASVDRRLIVGPGIRTTIDVVANDSDPDGDPSALRLQSVSLTSGSAAISSGDRLITIDPEPEFVGDVVVDYVIIDTDGLTASSTVTLTITRAPNRPPTARDDAAVVVNGGTVELGIALNDEDPDGDPLTYSLIAGATSDLGTAVLNGTTLRFVSTPGASGVAKVTYQVDDGEAVATAVATITVEPCSVLPPSAPDLFLQTGYEQPISIDLTAQARNGLVVDVGLPLGVPSGVYTPPAGENGNVSFTYAVRNSCRIQDIGTVVIDVNQAPLATAATVRMGRTATIDVAVTALASDAEDLRIVGLEGGEGWIEISDQQRALTLTPAGRSGSFAVVAIVSDPGGLQVRVPVSVGLVNLAPVATADTVLVPNGPLEFSPLANDADADGDTIELSSVPSMLQFGNGASGQISRVGTDRLRIDPGGGVGVATFTYTIVDSLGLESAAATVTVKVNSAPVAAEFAITVDYAAPVTLAVPASDPDGDALTLAVGVTPAGLSITVDGLNVTVTAELPERDLSVEVPYTVMDPGGRSASSMLRITTKPTPTTTTTTTTTTTSTSTTTTSTSTTTSTTSTTVPDDSTSTTSSTSTTTTTSSTTTSTTVPTGTTTTTP